VKSAITIFNYEEFFLLYADGELCDSDKLAVEQFVHENPELAVELEMLQQVRLTKEDFVFENKDSLYRSESLEISLHNYEEQFLLYVDNELNATDAANVETFVLQHPALQETFTLLKNTKLEPEAVSFPDKQLLYRKEEKEKPVFYLHWQRIAVAAAFIGFAVLLWTVLPYRKESQQPIASLRQQTIPVTNEKGGSQKNKSNDVIPVPVSAAQTAANVAPLKNETVHSDQEIVSSNPSAEENNLIARNEAPVKSIETAREDVIATQQNNFETMPAKIVRIPGDNHTIDYAEVKKPDVMAVNNDNIHAAVYKELDTEPDDEKKSLLLGSLDINKDKLRGFFRKAGSLFRSKSKTDEDKTESRPSANTRSLK
jgi:hypothetical protein